MNKSTKILSPVDILLITAREWPLIGLLITIGLALTYGTYQIVPKYYEASTLIMPPQQQQSATSSALAQLGTLSGLASSGGGVKTPEEIYAALLRTKRIQSGVVKNLGLQKYYNEESHEAALLKLASLVTVSTDKKSGLITIAAADRGAIKAAEIANSYISELRILLSKIAVTEAQQRKKYLEEQLNLAIKSFDDYEKDFFLKQQSKGMVTSQALAESKIKVAAEIRRAILEKEVALATMSRFSTFRNVERQGAEASLTALKGQLKNLEEGDASIDDKSEIRGAEASKIFRTMKAQELSIDGLLRQLQIARLDEVREAPLIQQIDSAEPPAHITRPKKIVFMSIGLSVGVFIALFVGCLVGIKKYNPEK